MATTTIRTLQARELEVKDRAGILHGFRCRKGVASNRSHPDLKIRVLDDRETNPKGRRQHFTWPPTCT